MGYSAGFFPYSWVQWGSGIKSESWSNWKNAITSDISGTGSFTNQLQYGVDTMQSEAYGLGTSNAVSRERIAVMLAADVPCGPFKNGSPQPECETGEQTGCTYECPGDGSYICSERSDLISDDIRLIVIYSSPTEDFDYSCVTQSDSDVFYISDAYTDSFGSLGDITSNVLDIMCPLDTYSLTISEIKVDSSSLDSLSAYDAPFIEILNENSFPIRLDSLLFSGLVTGTISSNDTATLKVNQYLVIYDAGIGSVSCSDCTECTTSDGHECDDAIYIPCGSAYDCSFDDSMVCVQCYAYCA